MQLVEKRVWSLVLKDRIQLHLYQTSITIITIDSFSIYQETLTQLQFCSAVRISSHPMPGYDTRCVTK